MTDDTRPRVVTLTTDFGVRDAYVGVMKGVILERAPGCSIVDITHGVPPQGVLHAAFVVASAAPFFPDGTVHVVVVDPGVGTERRAVAVRTATAVFVAPDNGVLTAALAEDPVEKAVHLTEPRYWLKEVSSTVHGRDIFAPVAAALARGIDVAKLGNAITDLHRLPVPTAVRDADGTIRGEIVSVDHFGNCVTNVGARLVDPGRAYDVLADEHRLTGVQASYGAVPIGAPVVLLGSTGTIEIAVRNGNAADALGLEVGTPVVLAAIAATRAVDGNG